MAKQTQTQTPDEMQVMLNKSEAFITKYKMQMIAAVVAIVVVAGGLFFYNNYSKSAQEEASDAMFAAQEYFANQKFDEALNGDKKSCKGFKYVADNYSSTKAGNLAKLYAGLCAANLEKWQDAVNYLEDYSTQGDAVISPAALFALGNAYANTKNLDKAVETMKKAADKADAEAKDGVNNSFSPTYLITAADILLSQGKNDEALAIYQDIKKKYVGSMAYQEIDKYIERANASKK